MTSRIMGLGERLEREGIGQKILLREPDALEERDLVSLSDVLSYMLQNDPGRGKNLRWMAECYSRGGYLLEDLYKVREALSEHARVKRQLAPQHRDIGRFTTLSELEDVIEPYAGQETLSSRAEERRLRDEVMAETIVLVERDDFKAVIPLTVRAGQWWGRGTKWCTATKNPKDSRFESYSKRGALVVFSWADGTKWQLYMTHAENPSIQFMNARDVMVPMDDVEERWRDIEPFMLAVLNALPEYRRIPNFLSPEKVLNIFADKNSAMRRFPSLMFDRPAWVGVEHLDALVEGLTQTKRGVSESFYSQVCKTFGNLIPEIGHHDRAAYVKAIGRLCTLAPQFMPRLVDLNDHIFGSGLRYNPDIAEVMPWHLIREEHTTSKNPFPSGHPARTPEMLAIHVMNHNTEMGNLSIEEIKSLPNQETFLREALMFYRNWKFDDETLKAIMPEALKTDIDFLKGLENTDLRKMAATFPETMEALMRPGNEEVLKHVLERMDAENLPRLTTEQLKTFFKNIYFLPLDRYQHIVDQFREDRETWKIILEVCPYPLLFKECPFRDDDMVKHYIKACFNVRFTTHTSLLSDDDLFSRQVQTQFPEWFNKPPKIRELAEAGVPPFGILSLGLNPEFRREMEILAWERSGYRIEHVCAWADIDKERYRLSLEHNPEKYQDAFPPRSKERWEYDNIMREFLQGREVEKEEIFLPRRLFTQERFQQIMLLNLDLLEGWSSDFIEEDSKTVEAIFDRIIEKHECPDFEYSKNFSPPEHVWTTQVFAKALSHPVLYNFIPSSLKKIEAIERLAKESPESILPHIREGVFRLKGPKSAFETITVPVSKALAETLKQAMPDDPRLVELRGPNGDVLTVVPGESLKFWIDVAESQKSSPSPQS